MSSTRSKKITSRSRGTATGRVEVAVVACGTAIAFLPTVRNNFVNFDDDRLLLHNPYLRLPWTATLRWILSTTFLGHYQPLTWLSLWFDYAVAGMSPLVYHIDSLAWHALAAVVAYSVLADLLARTETGRSTDGAHLRACAAAGALFWAVHPLRVESVAWISERRDVVSVVFLLLALRAYLVAVDAGDWGTASARWRVISYGCLLLSLLAKAWGMTFFVSLIAIDLFPLRRLPIGAEAFAPRYRRIWREKLPYAVLGAAGGAAAWLAQRGQPDTMVATADWSWSDRFLQAAYGVCFYVWKTAWPTRLAAMYELPDRLQPGSSWIFLGSVLVVTIAAAIVLWTVRTYPAILAASLAYVATVAPVLGFAQSGPQLVADRYAYVASLPFSALVAGGVLILTRRFPWRVVAMTAGCLLAVLATLTWRQTEVWRDSTTLWSHALESGHPSYIAYLNYGQAVRAEGRLDEAIARYRDALALRPQAGNAWYNLANALKAAGRYDEAERAYLTAIDRLSWKVDAQVNLGNMYFTNHRIEAAIRQYRAATDTLSHVPPAEFSPEPFLYLGIALSDGGDRQGARDALAVAIRYPATRARAAAEIRRLANQ
jgi:protein O-mannosyl-transferase